MRFHDKVFRIHLAGLILCLHSTLVHPRPVLLPEGAEVGGIVEKSSEVIKDPTLASGPLVAGASNSHGEAEITKESFTQSGAHIDKPFGEHTTQEPSAPAPPSTETPGDSKNQKNQPGEQASVGGSAPERPLESLANPPATKTSDQSVNHGESLGVDTTQHPNAPTTQSNEASGDSKSQKKNNKDDHKIHQSKTGSEPTEEKTSYIHGAPKKEKKELDPKRVPENEAEPKDEGKNAGKNPNLTNKMKAFFANFFRRAWGNLKELWNKVRRGVGKINKKLFRAN